MVKFFSVIEDDAGSSPVVLVIFSIPYSSDFYFIFIFIYTSPGKGYEPSYSSNN